MFFQKYELKDEHSPGRKVKIAVAAILGEEREKSLDKDLAGDVSGLKRELMYTSVDYTLGHINVHEWKRKAEKGLIEVLNTNDMRPLMDKLEYLDGQFRKSIGNAYMKSKVAKQYLLHHLGEIEEKQGAELAELQLKVELEYASRDKSDDS